MPHVRQPKLIEERLQRHREFVVSDPTLMAGAWRTLYPDASYVRVDLGCGKGRWATDVAQQNPHDLIIGVDHELMCVSFAAEYAAVGGVASSGQDKTRFGYRAPKNVRFTCGSARSLAYMFAPGEIDALHLNFPTPFPKKKHTAQRIVTAEHFNIYQPLLSPSGLLHVKTDSQPLFDYALEQISLCAFDVMACSRDMHGDATHARNKTADTQQFADGFCAIDYVKSAYEERLLQRGAVVYGFVAKPNRKHVVSTPPTHKSLYDYLPDDLEAITYVPLGMENALTNMKNRIRNGH